MKISHIIIAGAAALSLSLQVNAQRMLDNSDISATWRSKPIVVKNGGEKPNIITLLGAFNHQHPTWAVGEILKRGKTLADGATYESDDDWRVLVDRKNGYADLSSETDQDQASACIWRKTDGHRIFAVDLFQANDPVPSLLCWYDYDPQTQTLTPTHSPLDDFKPSGDDAQVFWSFPMMGTDLEVQEYHQVLSVPVTHVYKWDRQRFTLSSSQVNMFEYFPSAGSTHYEMLLPSAPWTHYAFVDLTGGGETVMLLGQLSGRSVVRCIMLGQYKGNVCVIGESDPDKGSTLAVYELPANNKQKRVAVQTHDAAGGYTYNILEGCNVQFVVGDRPDFSKPMGMDKRIVEVEEGWGSDDESIEILEKLGAERDPLSGVDWHRLTIIEEELP